jgi:hypothetical protein
MVVIMLRRTLMKAAVAITAAAAVAGSVLGKESVELNPAREARTRC